MGVTSNYFPLANSLFNNFRLDRFPLANFHFSYFHLNHYQETTYTLRARSMVKEKTHHAYRDRPAFERLMVLIATLVQYPGVGAALETEEPTGGDQEDARNHDAMEQVREQMQQVALALGLDWSECSVHTLRKDLRTLRRYGLLESRMYRWGYYLGTGALRRQELQLALQALASQAQHQGDPLAKQAYGAIERRLRGLNLQLQGRLLYPVRAHWSRSIVYTDPEEMMRLGQYRQTLVHQLEVVERAIVRGQAIEVYQQRDPYGTAGLGAMRVYPLQLLYAEIAWYLLYERVEDGHWAVERIDRLGETVRVLEVAERGIEAQQASLTQAHQLLRNGWGLYLGQPEEQRQERRGELELVAIVVRFFPPVTTFIREGEQRHPRQQIRLGAQGAYVDYAITLPPRSVSEFCRWVYRFMQCAQILAPLELAETQRQGVMQLMQRLEAQKLDVTAIDGTEERCELG